MRITTHGQTRSRYEDQIHDPAEMLLYFVGLESNAHGGNSTSLEDEDRGRLGRSRNQCLSCTIFSLEPVCTPRFRPLGVVPEQYKPLIGLVGT